MIKGELTNERALWILNKKKISDEDKEFLKLHIEMLKDFAHSLQGDISFLKDSEDYWRDISIEVQMKMSLMLEKLKNIETEDETVRKAIEDIVAIAPKNN